jgi:hypothetical protein
MVLGAGLSARHDGAIPVLALVAGLGLAAALLAGQAALGLGGADRTLSTVAAALLPPAGRWGLDLVLVVSMAGWLGFNLALGGGALGALLGLGPRGGALLYALPVLLLALGGLRRWNAVAVVATSTGLVLAAVVTARLGAPAAPLTPRLGAPVPLLASVAAFVGYASVFSVRAPDFTAGLASGAEVARCVALLIGATAATSVVGALLYLATGTTDLVGALAGPGGLAIGNVLLAVAFLAGSLSAVHSGGLALASVTGSTTRAAMLAMTAVGAVLAVAGFDRHLLAWLTLLGAAMPPIILPMALEGARRRRGRRSRRIPTWTWFPASALGVALTVGRVPGAALASLGVAAAATAGWAMVAKSPSGVAGHDGAPE